MKTQSADTHPDAERFLVSLFRQLTVAKRIEKMCLLTRMTIQLSRRAIVRRNPGLSDREIDLLFVKYHYGEDLANRLSQIMNLDNP